MPSFTAKRISADDNLLFPDRIEIDGDRVIVYKNALIGYSSSVLHRSNIASVKLSTGLFFADVYIESFGGRIFEVNGLSNRDARRVYQLLNP